MRPYEVAGVWYRPHAQPGYDEVGLATWYVPQSASRRTADGELFNAAALTAAHKTLPLPCRVEVTSLDTGRRIEVRVNDRGPFVPGRIIDLSPKAARELGIVGRGSARVRVRYLGPASAIQTVVARTPASAPVAARWRIQAGAFADRANADRAVVALSGQGATRVEPFSRDGTTLYRVELECPPDTTPEDLRRQVVAAGFPGARVVAGS